MGLSKFVLIFTVLKLMNQIKFYCQKKTPMTGITYTSQNRQLNSTRSNSVTGINRTILTRP